ncbi:MAG TPA: hypothetical protein VLB85_09245 [Acidimicrobiia bacterium]|nr:hypothetical protein [Acidimicrobiia bacterium]
MRALLALIVAALAVVGGMVLLAGLMFPDLGPAEAATPTGMEVPDQESTSTTVADGHPVIDPTTHVGGTLTVSGDRPGTFTLQGEDSTMSGYTLAGSGDRITFAQDDDGALFVDHVTYDGLDFYLDPGECEIEPGEVNTDLGISTVAVTCPEITDLRDTATVTVEGTVGVASTLTREDLPRLGGTITVEGDVELVLEVEAGTWVQFPEEGTFPGDYANLHGSDGIPVMHLEEIDDGRLAVTGVGAVDDFRDVEPDTCRSQTEQVAVVSPGVTYHRLILDCPAVPLLDGGVVSITGEAVIQRMPFRG